MPTHLPGNALYPITAHIGSRLHA